MTEKNIDRKIKIGCIGVGQIGKHHLENYSKIEDAEIVAIADHDEAELSRVANQYNVPNSYTDFRELLDCFAELPDPASRQPTAIIAHTVAGKGVSFMEDRFEWHLGYLAPDDQARALAELGESR